MAFGPLDRKVVAAFVRACRERKGGHSWEDGSGALREFLFRRPATADALESRYSGEKVFQREMRTRNQEEKLALIAAKVLEEDDAELERIIDLAAGLQTCDISRPLVALSIIQAFGTADFGWERDSVFATLQTAAALLGWKGIGKVPDGQDVSSSPQLAAAMSLLGECWRTVLRDPYTERCWIRELRRTLPGMRTAGLGFGKLKRELFNERISSTSSFCLSTPQNPRLATFHGTLCAIVISKFATPKKDGAGGIEELGAVEFTRAKRHLPYVYRVPFRDNLRILWNFDAGHADAPGHVDGDELVYVG